MPVRVDDVADRGRLPVSHLPTVQLPTRRYYYHHYPYALNPVPEPNLRPAGLRPLQFQLRPDWYRIGREQNVNNANPNADNVIRYAKPTASTYILLVLTFLVSLSVLLFVYYNFPELEPDEREFIKLPRNIDDAKNLGKVLNHYKSRYYFEVLSGVFITYIFLQAFAIPGSLFLSILSGFLFPFYIALTLVCLCSTLGASLCYLLSELIGAARIVTYFFPSRVSQASQLIRQHKDNMLFYVIFLRVTPVLPNWLINLMSPVINVPLGVFAAGTFLGVAPPSFIAIQAGRTLNEMTSSSDAFSFYSIALLFLFAFVSLVPVWFKSKLKDKLE